MREIIEAQAAHLIILPIKDEDSAAIEAICQRYSDAVAAHDMKSVIEANKLFHTCLYRLCGNAFLYDVIDNMAQRANLVRFSSSTDPTLLAQARDEHFGILRALRGTDNDALAQLCIEHMQPSRRRYLERHAWSK